MLTTSNYKSSILCTITLMLFTAFIANAEPWISNRYAQNCAGCHAPARRNLPPPKRRCTLSCQGCHVNPNGGGLRNFYGKWNQKKWLRSFQSDSMFDPGEKKPAPLKKQKYAKHPKGKLSKKWSNKISNTSIKGHKLVTTNNENINEKHYDRSDKQEHITAKNRKDFEYRITKNDPYRLTRNQLINMGLDFRYLSLSMSGDNVSDDKKNVSWPMSFDVGLQLRPYTEYISFVYEGRYLNELGGDFNTLIENEYSVKSAYAMVENLPYAIYIMGGVYRPMFGVYNVDHETISQRFTGFGARSTYKAVGIGGSPNVPFFNVSTIEPYSDTEGPQDKGFVASFGGRFVTKSASIQLSFWDTTSPSDLGLELKKKMYSLSFGGQVKRWTLGGEGIFIEKEFFPGAIDKAVLTIFDAKYRLYKENYLVFNSSSSNVAFNFKEGHVTERTLGFKSFLYSGLELEVAGTMFESLVNEDTTQTTLIKVQAHLYY